MLWGSGFRCQRFDAAAAAAAYSEWFSVGQPAVALGDADAAFVVLPDVARRTTAVSDAGLPAAGLTGVLHLRRVGRRPSAGPPPGLQASFTWGESGGDRQRDRRWAYRRPSPEESREVTVSGTAAGLTGVLHLRRVGRWPSAGPPPGLQASFTWGESGGDRQRDRRRAYRRPSPEESREVTVSGTAAGLTGVLHPRRVGRRPSAGPLTGFRRPSSEESREVTVSGTAAGLTGVLHLRRVGRRPSAGPLPGFRRPSPEESREVTVSGTAAGLTGVLHLRRVGRWPSTGPPPGLQASFTWGESGGDRQRDRRRAYRRPSPEESREATVSGTAAGLTGVLHLRRVGRRPSAGPPLGLQASFTWGESGGDRQRDRRRAYRRPSHEESREATVSGTAAGLTGVLRLRRVGRRPSAGPPPGLQDTDRAARQHVWLAWIRNFCLSLGRVELVKDSMTKSTLVKAQPANCEVPRFIWYALQDAKNEQESIPGRTRVHTRNGKTRAGALEHGTHYDIGVSVRFNKLERLTMSYVRSKWARAGLRGRR